MHDVSEVGVFSTTGDVSRHGSVWIRLLFSPSLLSLCCLPIAGLVLRHFMNSITSND